MKVLLSKEHYSHKIHILLTKSSAYPHHFYRQPHHFYKILIPEWGGGGWGRSRNPGACKVKFFQAVVNAPNEYMISQFW